MSQLERLRATCASLPEVRLAVLFGSAARGEGHAASDVDVGVLLGEGPHAGTLRLAAALSHAAEGSVDLVLLDRAPPLLRFEIARDGVLLLERVGGEWVRFKTEAMLDWWDWAPTAKRVHRAAAARLERQVTDGQT